MGDGLTCPLGCNQQPTYHRQFSDLTEAERHLEYGDEDGALGCQFLPRLSESPYYIPSEEDCHDD